MNDQYFGNRLNPSDNVEEMNKDTNPDEHADLFVSDIPVNDAAHNEEMQFEEDAARNALVDEPHSEEILMGIDAVADEGSVLYVGGPVENQLVLFWALA